MAGSGSGSIALAQSVALAGTLGNKALLVVNGGAPKAVLAGETHLNVKVISTSGDQALLEFSGKRHTLRVGDAPLSVGASASAAGQSALGKRITLTASSGGHFMTQGQINGRAVLFMVDTGATSVAIGAADAERAGLDYKKSQRVQINTANGVVAAYRLLLDSVRIGNVEVFGVEAVVTPQSMPFVLLGNAFLNRFQMVRHNDQMTLEKRF